MYLAEDVSDFSPIIRMRILICITAYPLLRACRKEKLQLVFSLCLSISTHVLMFTVNLRILKYVKGAVGETDVPDALPEFISQRRRWLNGSFFAATYAIAHTGQILRSGHSFARKMVLLAETCYNIINLVFSWFSIVRALISSVGGRRVAE
jgi:hypothetical protein